MENLHLAQSTTNDEWVKDIRGSICLVVTIISTVTFQMVNNPPGGVRPVKEVGDIVPCIPDNNDIYQLCPGGAILGVVHPYAYFMLFVLNTVRFISSLSVCLLLASGISLNHRFPMWFLSTAMCATLTSFALTYVTAMTLATLNPVWGPAPNFLEKFILTWAALVTLLALFYTLRFLFWVLKLHETIVLLKRYKYYM